MAEDTTVTFQAPTIRLCACLCTLHSTPLGAESKQCVLFFSNCVCWFQILAFRWSVTLASLAWYGPQNGQNGFKYFLFSPRKLGKIPILTTAIFFRWVETTNQMNICRVAIYERKTYSKDILSVRHPILLDVTQQYTTSEKNMILFKVWLEKHHHIFFDRCFLRIPFTDFRLLQNHRPSVVDQDGMKAMIGESMNWKTIGCLGRNKNIQSAANFRVEWGVVFEGGDGNLLEIRNARFFLGGGGWKILPCF